MDQRLKYKTQNNKNARRKHSKICDIFLSNIFFSYISLGKGNKRKNKQMRLHQTKKVLHSKKTINKIKRQPAE